MDAFASGTDIANSQGDGFQLVFGHVLTAPVIHSWVTMGGVIKEGLTPEELSFIIDDVSNLTPRGSSVRTTVAIEEEYLYGEYVPSGSTMETSRSEATSVGYSKYLFAQADLSAHTIEFDGSSVSQVVTLKKGKRALFSRGVLVDLGCDYDVPEVNV